MCRAFNEEERMHEAMLKLADLLGASIAFGSLMWPVGFTAVKGSLKLRYRWWAFLLGYAAVMALNTVALAALGFFIGNNPVDRPTIGEGSFDWFTLFTDWGLPLAISVTIALLMAPYLRQKNTQQAEARSPTN
jgi:hypothetical protein